MKSRKRKRRIENKNIYNLKNTKFEKGKIY